jgi:hypothetical protein
MDRRIAMVTPNSGVAAQQEVNAIHKEMYPSLKATMRKNRIIPL